MRGARGAEHTHIALQVLLAFGTVGWKDLKSKASLSCVVRPTDSSKVWGTTGAK